MAFFFGFYPKRACTGNRANCAQNNENIVPGDSYRALPLSMLAGMSYTHELRLEREGFDNLENLSNADAVDLAVRTCFSYTQLKQWIDQAWLAAHLREDYPDFVRRTGITSSEELRCFFCSWRVRRGRMEWSSWWRRLSADPAAASSWKVRLTALKILLESIKPRHRRLQVPRSDEHENQVDIVLYPACSNSGAPIPIKSRTYQQTH